MARLFDLNCLCFNEQMDGWMLGRKGVRELSYSVD